MPRPFLYPVSPARNPKPAPLLRRGPGILTALLAVPIALTWATPARAEDFPKRKPGLWEMQSSGGPTGGMRVARQCIDARTDALLRGQSDSGQGNCEPRKVSRRGEAYVVHQVCRRDGVSSTIDGEIVMSGDSAYKGSMKMRFDPPTSGVSEMNMTLNGRWVGPCTAGMKPGDFVTEGMPRTNLLNKDGAAPSNLTPEQAKALREQMQERLKGAAPRPDGAAK